MRREAGGTRFLGRESARSYLRTHAPGREELACCVLVPHSSSPFPVRRVRCCYLQPNW